MEKLIFLGGHKMIIWTGDEGTIMSADLLRNLGTAGRMVGLRAFMSAVRVCRLPAETRLGNSGLRE